MATHGVSWRAHTDKNIYCRMDDLRLWFLESRIRLLWTGISDKEPPYIYSVSNMRIRSILYRDIYYAKYDGKGARGYGRWVNKLKMKS